MKIHAIEKALRQAYSASTFNNASFNKIGWGVKAPVVTMRDGSPVTEANVTDFIRERTEIFRSTWVLDYIQEALEHIAASRPHAFEPPHPGFAVCVRCGMGSVHRLHKGFKQ